MEAWREGAAGRVGGVSGGAPEEMWQTEQRVPTHSLLGTLLCAAEWRELPPWADHMSQLGPLADPFPLVLAATC